MNNINLLRIVIKSDIREVFKGDERKNCSVITNHKDYIFSK